jgi:hypothetical protein
VAVDNHIMLDLHLVEIAIGAAPLQLDTHKVAILVTIIKIIVRPGLVDLVAIFMDTEGQMGAQVTV